MRYVLVTGGVISGIGKGVICSSIGAIMKEHGWVVTCIKIDPYLNIDAGTFSPLEHGEVFVLDDGSEVDLDLGNYERFLDITLTGSHSITTGKIYRLVTERERRGEYLGKTVQVVPHITDAIQKWVIDTAEIPVDSSARKPDICLIELGGIIGDIESMPFVEAFRQLYYRFGKELFCSIHVSLVPNLSSVGEPKTKPTQVSIRELRARGLYADFLMCRCTGMLHQDVIDKLALFCQVPIKQVLMVPDVKNLYQVPLLLERQHFSDLLQHHFNFSPKSLPPTIFWKTLVDDINAATQNVSVAIAGKYTRLGDAYASIFKALEHAGVHHKCRVETLLVNTDDLVPDAAIVSPDSYHQAWLRLCGVSAVIVPGGFGQRGTEGMITVIRHCREHGIPFLGICLGFQLAVVEFARNVIGWMDATSSEFVSETTRPCIIEMPEFNPKEKGGTMRLGSRRTCLALSPEAVSYIERNDLFKAVDDVIKFTNPAGDSAASASEVYLPDLTAYKMIKKDHIYARHRHRFEINPDIVPKLESEGFIFLGRDAEIGNRMEIGEMIRPASEEATKAHSSYRKGTVHPFFIGTQFHPEFTSRPMQPSPFFIGLIGAAILYRNQRSHV